MKWLRKFCRKHKRFLIVFIIILIIFVGFIAGSVLYNKHIESQMATIADKFHPDSSWQLKSSVAISTYPACISIDQPCPSLERYWQLKKPLTKQELAKKLTDAGWYTSIDGDCLPSPQSGGYDTTCDSSSTDNGYVVRVNYNGDAFDKRYNVEIKISRYVN